MTGRQPPRPAGPAHQVLATAVADARAAGLIVPCLVDPTDTAWIAEDALVLHAAARRCDGCPALAECRAAGRSADWGVWGGRVELPKWLKHPDHDDGTAAA